MTTRVLALSLIAACASSTPGARPHDMSAANHEAAARDHDRAAADHDRQYDERTMIHVPNCRPNFPRPPICWTSIQNPTDDHRRAADAHQKAAADHRAASRALRNAEASACVGLADTDRDGSPFDHVEDIASVVEHRELRGSKVQISYVTGLTVTFRARPGMTGEWLQRIADCHIARSGALGHDVPEMPDCPLVPRDVKARVSSSGNGFAVTIRSSDPDSVRELLARGERLRHRIAKVYQP